MRFVVSTFDLSLIRRITDHYKSFPVAVAALVNFILTKCPELVEITIGFETFSASTPIPVMYIQWTGWLPQEILQELRHAEQTLQNTGGITGIGQRCRALWGCLHHTASSAVTTAEESGFDPYRGHHPITAYLSESALERCLRGQNGILARMDETLPPSEQCLSEICWHGLGIGNEINRKQRRTPERLVRELPRHLDHCHHAKVLIKGESGELFRLRTMKFPDRNTFLFHGMLYTIVTEDKPLNVFNPGVAVTLEPRDDSHVTVLVQKQHPSIRISRESDWDEATTRAAREHRRLIEIAFAVATSIAPNDPKQFWDLFSQATRILAG